MVCPQNRRKIEVTITEDGLNLIRQSIPRIEDTLNGYYKSVIDEQERIKVVDVMRRIR
jgi:DNA-binding MarR family transcriptional regulator